MFAYFEGNSSRTTRGNYEDTTQETVTVTDYFTPTYTGNLALRFYGISDFTGSIDNLSVKELTDADFDFDRNSTGTRVNEDYLIEDVPYNLLTYSEDFSVWSKEATVTLTSNYGLAPDGTQTSTRMQMDANDSIYRSVSSGNTFSVHIKGVAGETIRVANGTTITHTLTGRWDRVSVHDSGDSSTQVTLNTYSSATARDIQIWGAQLVKGDQPKDYLKTTDRLDIPRIDYTNGEPSILLEPSRTNEILHSNQFDTTWSTGFSTITGSSGVSPSGINNAWKLESTTVGAETRVRQSHTFSIGESVTISCFMKAGTVDFGIVRCYAISGGGRAWFNLSNGTVGTENSGITGSIQEYPNGWYRCIISFTTNQSGAIDIAPAPADNDYLANATGENILIYGAQLETGSYPTSLIHTSGSAVTRSADAANNAGNSDLFNDSEGVLYAEISSLSLSGGDGYISITDGTASNRITLRNTSTLNNVVSQCVVGGVNQASMDFILQDRTLKNKIAFRYKANDFSLYVNGQEVLIDTSGTVPSGLKELSFNNGAGVGQWYGNAKMVAVFKEALSDEELEKLTGYNNHELYMNYYNRLSYLGLVEEYNVESDINNYIL
jgi:hypothetical protein